MSKTRGGVFLNLEESTYTYKFKNFKFVFSSLFNKNRFIDNVNQYLLAENQKINIKLGYKIDLTDVLILRFYEKIEHRGYMVDYKGNKVFKNTKFKVNIDL